jgi:hypothetical protein
MKSVLFHKIKYCGPVLVGIKKQGEKIIDLLPLNF